MAMVELAARERAAGSGPEPSDRPVSLADIAGAQLLSVAYLEQIFARLRRGGLVASARGPGGGYRLARPAREIRIADIIEAVDEAISTTRCDGGAPGCLGGQRCLTHDLWAELGDQIRLFLQNISLADVVEQQILGRAAPPHPAHDRPHPAEAAQAPQ